MQQINHGLN